MKRYISLLVIGLFATFGAKSAIIELHYDLDADNVPTYWTNTPVGSPVSYALGDTLMVEFGFGENYVTVSDDNGVNWITPWLLAANTGTHTIANATLGYRDLNGDIIDLAFTLLDDTSSAWHLGGYRWDNFLGAGDSITLQSFVATFDVVAAGSVQQITGHYFGLNGVNIVNEGTIPDSMPVPEPATLLVLLMGLLGMRRFHK